jgi:succinate dehydrogenase / fumarate reductase cytochrome b subunit
MWRIYSVHNILFIFHRLTGLGLLAYLLAHVVALSSALLSGPAVFDSLMKTFAGRDFIGLELFLVACLVFHAINGVRLILVERGMSLPKTEPLAAAGALVAVIISLAAGWVAFFS